MIHYNQMIHVLNSIAIQRIENQNVGSNSTNIRCNVETSIIDCGSRFSSVTERLPVQSSGQEAVLDCEAVGTVVHKEVL